MMNPIRVENLVKKGNEYIADVEWDKFPGELIKTHLQPKMDKHLKDLYKDIVKGSWGEAVVFVEPPEVITNEQKQVSLTVGIQSYLDTEAKAYGYDSLISAISYADEPSVTKFQTEGQAFRLWRSLVWEKCYEILAQWEAGSIAEPTLDEILVQLPELII